MVATPVRFVLPPWLSDPQPEIVSGLFNLSANTLAITFSRQIEAGTLPANLLRVDGIGATFKSGAPGPYVAGTVIIFPMTNQLGGTSGSPRVSYNAPLTPFETADAQIVTRFTDFPISTTP